ncbi:hypothetical protein [Anaerobaca lacustris]|uniref:Uncharacterized protein n=1 Tax=Anaerobaca lacustris TaxID=3044600 RepID=A0AAW6TV01_9BACT|nr:hypothetical protein [Sedimentisphaerales bacterium M17dextr]
MAERVVICSISCLPIRPPMLLARSGLRVGDGLEAAGGRTNVELRASKSMDRRMLDELSGLGVVGMLGAGVRIEGADRHVVGGVRTLERSDGLGAGEGWVVGGGLGWLGRLIDGCLWITGLLRDGAVNERLGVEGAAGAERLMLGAGLGVGVLPKEKLPRVPSALLRLIRMLDCGGLLIRGLTDGLGAVDGRDMRLRLPCEGSVRCGVDREIEGAGRLGAGLVVCPLLWRLLSLVLRCALWASASETTSKAAVTAMATATATERDFSFVENIIDLLPPATRCPDSGTAFATSPPAAYTPCEIVRFVLITCPRIGPNAP